MRSKDELTLRTIEDFEKAEEQALLAADSCARCAQEAARSGHGDVAERCDIKYAILISRAHTAAVGRMLAKHLNGQQF